jgi:hypothetical protein
MGRYKLYPDPFDRVRNRHWNRQKAQANFRGEIWDLSFDDFRKIWTETTWPQRGRSPDNLCMTRYPDLEGPWTIENVVLINRTNHVTAKNKRKYGIEWEHLFAEVIYPND